MCLYNCAQWVLRAFINFVFAVFNTIRHRRLKGNILVTLQFRTKKYICVCVCVWKNETRKLVISLVILKS